MKILPVFFLFLASCSAKPTPDEVSLHFQDLKNPKVATSNTQPFPLPSQDIHQGMVHVVGNFCPEVKERCIVWKDDPSKTKFARCQEFAPSICVASKISMDFWIDKYEYKEKYTRLPMSNVTWTEAQNICIAEGKRLPTEEEWTHAAEGPEMFPYTTGFIRPTGTCNIDLEKDIVCGKTLCDHRREIDANPKCVSGYGAVNMAGSVDEWVESKPYQHSKQPNLWMRSSLKGGHWLGIRARTRPKTVDHEQMRFKQISIGFRCVSDK